MNMLNNDNLYTIIYISYDRKLYIPKKLYIIMRNDLICGKESNRPNETIQNISERERGKISINPKFFYNEQIKHILINPCLNGDNQREYINGCIEELEKQRQDNGIAMSTQSIIDDLYYCSSLICCREDGLTTKETLKETGMEQDKLNWLDTNFFNFCPYNSKILETNIQKCTCTTTKQSKPNKPNSNKLTYHKLIRLLNKSLNTDKELSHSSINNVNTVKLSFMSNKDSVYSGNRL